MSGVRWGATALVVGSCAVACLSGGGSNERTGGSGSLGPSGSESGEGAEAECPSDFECEAGKECADCECPCPGVFELWSRQLTRDSAHSVATGPDSETYFLLNQSPWLLRISKRGETLPVGDYDLSWTVDVPVVMGVDAERNLLVAGEVSPTGERDVHIERLSPDGEVLHAETLSVEGEDSLLGGRMRDDGTFIVVGRHFIATVSPENEWSVPIVGESIDGLGAAVGRDWVLLAGSTSQLVSLTGRAGASRTFSDSTVRYCAPTLGVNDGAFELCTDVSSGFIEIEVSALDRALERVWTFAESHSSGSVNAAVAAVEGGALYSSTRSSTRRLDDLGDVIAQTDGSGLLLSLTSTDVLSIGFNGSTVRRLYAPPRLRQLRETGESCSDHADCESALCCQTTMGTLGTCIEGDGCAEGALCVNSSDCEGICESDFAGVEAPRCRSVCEASADCGDGSHCVEVDCIGDRSCSPICVDDCLARGDADCEANDRCVELDDTGRFACLPACTGVECGVVDGVQCGLCPTDASCENGTCVGGVCYGWECGVDDGVGCGSCDEGEFCNADHRCETACARVECGDDNGVDCGDCDGDQVCDEGSCRQPCTEMECGQDHGINCGSCKEDEFCEANQCQPACVDMDCGQDNGIACGECGEREYCDTDNTCAQACVDMECGQDNGIACGECAEQEYCDSDNTCAQPCANMECGFDDVFECGTCPEGQACDRGLCVTEACDPSFSSFCQGQAIYDCVDGLMTEFVESCSIFTYCVQEGVRAACRYDTCTAYSPLCEGTVLGMCNGEGSGLDLAEAQTDCGEQGLDCSRAGCGEVTVDRVGFPSQTGVDVSGSSYWIVGNFYEVTTNTTLVEYKPDLDMDEWELRWHIYRSETRDGPYSTTQNIRSMEGGPNSGLVDTVPYFSYELEAGYYYFIGVEAAARTLPAIARFDDTQSIAEVSFGTVLGGHIGEQGSTLEFTPTSYVVTQELTTALLAESL